MAHEHRSQMRAMFATCNSFGNFSSNFMLDLVGHSLSVDKFHTRYNINS
jgi:hypothetical protein